MTKITSGHVSNRFMIGATGHTHYAGRGNDIVCASVSAIIQSFYLYCEDLLEEKKCTIEDNEVRDGYILLVVEGTDTDILPAYKMMMSGLRAIAHDYSDYVRIEK